MCMICLCCFCLCVLSFVLIPYTYTCFVALTLVAIQLVEISKVIHHDMKVMKNETKHLCCDLVELRTSVVFFVV